MSADRDLFGQAPAPLPPRRSGQRVHLPQSTRLMAQDMRRDGASIAEIAKAAGISSTTARCRLKSDLERGLPGGRRPGRPPWRPTADDLSRVAQLASAGATMDAMAETLGVTPPTLRRRCAAALASGRAARVRGAVVAPNDPEPSASALPGGGGDG